MSRDKVSGGYFKDFVLYFWQNIDWDMMMKVSYARVYWCVMLSSDGPAAASYRHNKPSQYNYALPAPGGRADEAGPHWRFKVQLSSSSCWDTVDQGGPRILVSSILSTFRHTVYVELASAPT